MASAPKNTSRFQNVTAPRRWGSVVNGSLHSNRLAVIAHGVTCVISNMSRKCIQSPMVCSISTRFIAVSSWLNTAPVILHVRPRISEDDAMGSGRWESLFAYLVSSVTHYALSQTKRSKRKIVGFSRVTRNSVAGGRNLFLELHFWIQMQNYSKRALTVIQWTPYPRQL